VADAVRAIAAQRGLPPAQIALAWVLGNEAVTAPVIGATRKQHLDDAVTALHLRLEQQEVLHLEQPYLPRLLSSYS
jgi:1-deoxyxylulose-5-phosphate synthase